MQAARDSDSDGVAVRETTRVHAQFGAQIREQVLCFVTGECVVLDRADVCVCVYVYVCVCVCVCVCVLAD